MGEWFSRLGDEPGVWFLGYTGSDGVRHDRVAQLVWCQRVLHESVAVSRIVDVLNQPAGAVVPTPGPWLPVRRTTPAPEEGRLPDVVEVGVQLAGTGVDTLLVWWQPPPRNVDGWTGRIVAAMNPWRGLPMVTLDPEQWPAPMWGPLEHEAVA